LSQSEQKEVNTQIKSWLDQGIIHLSCSDYASSILLLKKRQYGMDVSITEAKREDNQGAISVANYGGPNRSVTKRESV